MELSRIGGGGIILFELHLLPDYLDFLIHIVEISVKLAILVVENILGEITCVVFLFELRASLLILRLGVLFRIEGFIFIFIFVVVVIVVFVIIVVFIFNFLSVIVFLLYSLVKLEVLKFGILFVFLVEFSEDANFFGEIGIEIKIVEASLFDLETVIVKGFSAESNELGCLGQVEANSLVALEGDIIILGFPPLLDNFDGEFDGSFFDSFVFVFLLSVYIGLDESLFLLLLFEALLISFLLLESG